MSREQSPRQAVDGPAGLGAVLRQAPSWLVSTVFHMAILLVLALWMMPEVHRTTAGGIVLGPEEPDVLEGPELPPPDFARPAPPDVTLVAPTPEDQVTVEVPDELPPPAPEFDPDPFGPKQWPGTEVTRRIPGSGGPGTGYTIRDPSKRPGIPGVTPSGERAVALALKWLAEHQFPDGGWSFNHALAPGCRGQCRNPGELADARVAATGLALLPFLGSGQTHQKGPYKKTIRAGLYFLVAHVKTDAHGGALNEPGGRMYSHGIASIALCEAYAMTHDKGLYGPAQRAIQFICYAQDPIGGGWRYEPRQPGDTSVVGWQVVALKSGHLGYLQVPPVVIRRASTFLDTVQANSGASYGYTDPGAGRATTAIGLLCRMYLGWTKDNPALERGVVWLGKQGPSVGDMYYNYYAAQVMHHWDSPEAEEWNKKLTGQLVQAQATLGHEQGSWFVAGGDHGATKGGRLYTTAMATMILEVPYRILPIYGHSSVDEPFPD